MPDSQLVLNICGEGEIAGAINLNNLAGLLTSVEKILRYGPLIQADVLQRWPIMDNSMDVVVGNNIPGFDGHQREFVARESFRVLKDGGHLKLHSMSGKIPDWEATMKAVGFYVLKRESLGGSGYAVAVKHGDQP